MLVEGQGQQQVHSKFLAVLNIEDQARQAFPGWHSEGIAINFDAHIKVLPLHSLDRKSLKPMSTPELTSNFNFGQWDTACDAHLTVLQPLIKGGSLHDAESSEALKHAPAQIQVAHVEAQHAERQ